MNHQTIYIKLEKDGKTVINQHRVWDRDKFIESQIEQYSGIKVRPEDKHKVSIASKTEYEKARHK